MPRKVGEIRNNPRRVLDTWFYKVADVELEHMKWVEPKGRVKGHWVEDDREEQDKFVHTKERIVNKTVKVDWCMDKRTSQSSEPPHPLESVKFEIRCDEFNWKLEGTDIEALRAAMWAKLDKKFEIKWEQYYLVEVRRSRIYHGTGEGMELAYEDVWKGTGWDGKLLLREWRGHEEKVRPWPGEFKDEGGKVMARIEATKLNRAVLEEFGKRIGILRGKLADFLRPEVIMDTLANLAGFALLPPIPEKDKEGATDV